MHPNTNVFLISLLAFLSVARLAADDEIIWGKPQDGVRIGVQHNTKHHTRFAKNGLVVVYVKRATNYLRNLVLPSEVYQRLDYSLLSTNLQPVKLTNEGKKYGAKLKTGMPRWKRISLQLKNLGDEPQQMVFFHIDKCFVLTEPGEYELSIRPRLLKENGKDLLPVTFDPIKLRMGLLSNSE